MAEHCKYGETLEKMIRDRLVCGINDEAIEKKLLAEHELTYASALRMAQGLETATKILKEMQHPDNYAVKVKMERVNKLHIKGSGASSRAKPGLKYHRCGAPEP